MMTAVEITVVALICNYQQVKTILSLSPLNVEIKWNHGIQSSPTHTQQVQGSLFRPNYQSTQLANQPLLNKDLVEVAIPQVTLLRILLGMEKVGMDFGSITQQINSQPRIVIVLVKISKIV